jgi:CheY-like chemotaxis protein
MRAIERENGYSESGSRSIIIGMSANGNRAVCLSAGMDDFLPKPFCIKDLLDSYAKLTKDPL